MLFFLTKTKTLKSLAIGSAFSFTVHAVLGQQFFITKTLYYNS